MKKILLLSFVFSLSAAHSEETSGEKLKTGARTVKRQIKTGAHRVQEAICLDSDLECATRKTANVLTEAGSAIQDKVIEIKDKID